MSDSLTNTELELADRILRLVHSLAQGSTTNPFWMGQWEDYRKEIAALISDTVAKAEREAYKKGYDCKNRVCLGNKPH